MIFVTVLVIFGLISLGMMVLGGMLLFGKMKYDTAVTATVTAVTCEKEDPTKCNVTLTFNDKNDKEITRSAIVKGPITVGSTRGVLYDSENPSNFYPGQPPVRQVGAGLFFGGIAIALACAIATYYHWRRPSTTEQAQTEYEPEDNYYEKQEVPQPVLMPSAVSKYKSPSRSSPKMMESPLPNSPETERAKQYADYMVDKVTEPSRKAATNDEFQFK